MNKKFKIVSSIALAGMLLTSSLGMNKVQAAEPTDVTTNPVAVYRKLVEGRTVVPFVLANANDNVTVKDLVESDLFTGKVSTVNGSAIPSLETVLHTGDRFTTTDGTSHTIIIYGDVDERTGNPTVTALDALEIQKNIVNDVTLDDVQREAADVVNDGKVDILDALRIREFAVGNQTNIINELPPKEEVVEESNYTLSLKGASYINNQNYSDVKLNVSLKETLDKAKDLKLEIVDKDGNKLEKAVTVPAHTDFVEGFVTEDLTDLADGTITFNLLDGDKIVGTVNVEKNTVIPAAARVTTNRVSTRQATLSLESMGTSDVTKVRYIVKGINEEAPTAVSDLTSSADVQNNKLTDVTVAENLATNTAYKVYYVVENQYGSQSAMAEAVIASDATSVHAEKALDKVTAPDLTKGETSFSWEVKEAGKAYVATLYKDGVAVAEKTTDADATSVDFADNMTEAGTYKVAVVVKGESDGSTTDSKVTESSEVTVTKLNTVEDLKFENRENGKVVLSWKTSYSKDDFASYDIKVYTVNDKGELEDSKISLPGNNVDSNGKLINEVEVNLVPNTIYVAKVKLNAKADQTAVISSDEATSDEFYIVEAPNMDSAVKGTTSVTFTINPINIANKNVTYKVKVYDVNVNNDYTEARYTLKDTRDVVLDKDNKITIDGLSSLNTYAFKLVATVDGNEVESEYSDEIRTLPVIENLTVTKDSNKAGKGSGRIYSNGSSIVINGETFADAELAKAADMVYALEEGDVVTVDDKFTTISVKLDGNASVSNVTERDFTSCDLTNTTVEIESNKYAKTIKGNFNKLVLKGDGAIYTVDGVEGIDGEDPTIVVTDGVEVVGDKTYNVEANAEATINDVKVTTAEDVTIAASGTYLYVTANEVDNDLTFANETENKVVNIVFVGSLDNTSEQKGKITIETKGGSVSVTSVNVNVSAEMKVEVTNGTATITDPSLTGDKTVTVSADKDKTSTVVAVANTKAPVNMADIELKDYTDKEIEDLFPAIKDNQEKILAVREYINSFGINGKGAKITVAENSDMVTITLPGAAQGVTIGNLK